MKKFLLTALTLVTVAVVSIVGTVAYLTWDDSDVNVMTVGNVKIEQLEYERKVDENGNWIKSEYTGYGYTADEMQEFKNNKPAYPAVYQDGTTKWDDRNGSQAASGETSHQQPWSQIGAPGSNQLFDDSVKNVIDKFVFVKNTGSTNAYYRTVIAIECPEGFDADLIHTNVNSNSRFDWEDLGYTTVDGVRYFVKVATYNQVLTPGEISRPSLLQLFLDPATTNEDCALFGDTWEVLVVSQAVQAAGFDNAATALEEAFGEPTEKNPETGIMLAAEWFGEAIDDYEASLTDTWDGTYDTSWYNDTDTTFTLTAAEQLAGLAELVDGGNTFKDKTITLSRDMDFEAYDAEGELISFEPIGSYEYDMSFDGIFDGQGYTISNMYQNGWALENGYYDGDDLGLGLFGKVNNATIQNLTIDGADQPSEFNLIGTIAGAAYGECVFENITVSDSYMGNHSYYSGGLVGWASGDHRYINCDVDADTVISSQWGDFNNANGGIIGGAGTSGTYYFEDCDVACAIDAYNDVTSAYEWYAYRNCGMLIGNTGRTVEIDGTTYADASNVTAKNCTVTYGEWANYHYCQFNAMNYPWVRVEAGESCHAYGNARYDYATDANGNNVVDENHVHNDGEGHNVLLTFDQLFGGSQGGVYGNPVHDGVTVIYNNK